MPIDFIADIQEGEINVTHVVDERVMQRHSDPNSGERQNPRMGGLPDAWRLRWRYVSTVNSGQWANTLMGKKDSGFSLIEMMVVAMVMGIVGSIAIPQALSALKGYRLHSDGSSVSGYINLARMRAASQYAPYRLVVNISGGTYWIEKLCGITPTTTDAACTSAYAAYTTPQLEFGTQYALPGDTFSSCRPAFIIGGAFPGTLVADPSPCPDPLNMYFNTRGAPVDNTGSPLGSGGTALYIVNQNNMVDAVSTSLGGQAAIWTCPVNCSNWTMR